MNKKTAPYIFVITGAESTGKSVLSQQLAKHFDALYYPEYARTYISSINREYTKNDVEAIAEKQIEQYSEALNSGHEIIFFDTWLIITKIWFEVVYSEIPRWIDKTIQNANIKAFILNNIDIPWEPDPLRENGGDKREQLHIRYKTEIEQFGFPYYLNEGTGEIRVKNAIRFIENQLYKKS